MFNNFEYEGDFTIDLETNKPSLLKHLPLMTRINLPKNKYNLNIPPIKMVNTIKNSGFVLEKREDLVVCGYEYQYLYFFTKH